MKRPRLTLIPSAAWLAAAVLALFASLASAQAPAGARSMPTDSDGDGLVSREEFIASGARSEAFDAMDSNADGYIDDAERDAARDAMRARRGSRKSPEQRFAEIDTNGDGLISSEEFANLPSTPPIGFDEIDTNADGFIDAEERDQMRERARERMRSRNQGS